MFADTRITGRAANAPSTLRWRRTYPGRADQARLVRQFVGFLLAGDPLAEEVVFAAAELSANAVRHTRSGRPGGSFTVEIRHWRDGAAIAVTDQGTAGPPRSRDADELSESGRGLRTIQTIARCLHWTGDENGRTVFAIFMQEPPAFVHAPSRPGRKGM
ncbi:ATP-binding protein [Actinoallomurus purpureus]|uniref:ATP-binding protein n=1 Tax=Actinoallomurus purpureus TaxID=478114 RepID=UPI00209247F8|nr:ATP-binding protein [Actinoallomurus purpureus]MCO6009407.1 ATP-binding protein [Actinoallomurus purpureus]